MSCIAERDRVGNDAIGDEVQHSTVDLDVLDAALEAVVVDLGKTERRRLAATCKWTVISRLI